MKKRPFPEQEIQVGSRWEEIDILYTLGILLVLIGHSHSSDWSTFKGTVLESVIRFIYLFHMPLFFFIAGFLFRNSSALETKGYRAWIKAKALRLLTPYFFWSLAALVPKYYLENRHFAGIGKHLLTILINPRSGVWGHFWFLPVLFIAYAFFGMAGKLIIKQNVFVTAAVLLSGLLWFLPIETNYFCLRDIKSTFVFFALGMLAYQYAKGLREGTVPVVTMGLSAALAVILSAFGVKGKLADLMSACLMVYACWIAAMRIKNTRFTEWVSTHCFTIYIFSWFFQSVVMLLCDHIHLHWAGTFVLMLSVGFLAPACVILIYERLPFLHRRFVKLILGLRRTHLEVTV